MRLYNIMCRMSNSLTLPAPSILLRSPLLVRLTTPHCFVLDLQECSMLTRFCTVAMSREWTRGGSTA
jgi:hypothetical protein